jgi:hypothetical protein
LALKGFKSPGPVQRLSTTGPPGGTPLAASYLPIDRGNPFRMIDTGRNRTAENQDIS